MFIFYTRFITIYLTRYSDIYNRWWYKNYKFEFPESFSACEVVRLMALYLFFISECLTWQQVSMGRPGWEMQAGRGEIVDFVV